MEISTEKFAQYTKMVNHKKVDFFFLKFQPQQGKKQAFYLRKMLKMTFPLSFPSQNVIKLYMIRWK